MNSTSHARTVLALLLSLAAADALACGEVMYRMGGALHYRAFVTRHPAQILLYSAAADKAIVAETQAFHHNLEKAGHRVTVVDSPDALSRVLAERRYDVIIAFAADLPSISPHIGSGAREPLLIPVFAHESDGPALRARYPLAVKEDAKFNQFLKIIEQSMKARGT